MRIRFTALFSILSTKVLAAQVISVANTNEITDKYHEILQSDLPIAFHILDTQTVLVREPPPLMLETFLPFSWPFWPKPAPTGQDSYWLEMECKEPVIEECESQYFPISHCQTQENDAVGAVTFSYTVSNILGITRLTAGLITYTRNQLGLALALRFGLEVDYSASRTGETSCTLVKGQTGQILVQPRCASVEHRTRSVLWKDGLKKLVLGSQFSKYQKVKLLLAKNALQLHCATDDIAKLLCEGNSVRDSI